MNYIAIAPKKGEIAEYLTNGKSYPIRRFESYPIRSFFLDGKNEIITSKLIGRRFYIKADDGKEHFCLERDCGHLNGGNWKIKEVKEVKEVNFKTHLSDFLNRHNIDKAEFILYCGMAFLALIWLLGAITKAFI